MIDGDLAAGAEADAAAKPPKLVSHKTYEKSKTWLIKVRACTIYIENITIHEIYSHHLLTCSTLKRLTDCWMVSPTF
jgi:hypothetical protein